MLNNVCVCVYFDLSVNTTLYNTEENCTIHHLNFSLKNRKQSNQKLKNNMSTKQ